jgi:DNA topoisomerase II
LKYLNSWNFLDGHICGVEGDVVEFSPALVKVFDELLVNASDNTVRDKSCRNIEVEIDPLRPFIRVRNDGQGLPVEVHPTEVIDTTSHFSYLTIFFPLSAFHHVLLFGWYFVQGIYVPELIFGHLLTGSNFDDTSGKLTGGRHG